HANAVAADADTSTAILAPELPATPRDLTREKPRFAEPLRPKGYEEAMNRTRHRILGNTRSGCEIARDEVHIAPRIAGGRRDDPIRWQGGDECQVGCERLNLARIRENRDRDAELCGVAAPQFARRAAKGLGSGPGIVQHVGGDRRKIQDESIGLP